MDRKIKLIWDFRGPDSQKIAEHHVIHLNDYSASSNLKEHTTGVEVLSKSYSIAYIIVYKSEMLPVRDSLKPHRGEFVD
ncbi:hypothetical protein [Leeuwenhoekiella sp. MAR_2009_132]|uniref:hypothetical protein n=1 Tax=Leeuwenhoekiella sp. MAR_2009_132 TaxID=1392489 RepID=UPI00048E9341|nr:hypothetical protein [Leeuwenhoekiella sp. MAR_2009_132]